MRLGKDYAFPGLRIETWGTRQLITAIGDYIDAHNKNPKSFIWTAKANDILEKVTRAQTTLNKRRSA